MLAVQGHVVKLKVDTGAQVNILPIKELKRIVGSEPHLEPCKHKLVSYSENTLKVLGTVSLSVKSKNGFDQELIFHVVETNQPGLLGVRSSQDLAFIKVIIFSNCPGMKLE